MIRMKFKDIQQLTQIGSYQVNMPIKHFKQWIDENIDDGLQLNPAFQRGHIWNPDQQSSYIEFLLKGGQSGRVIYFNCPSWLNRSYLKKYEYNDFVCVDGLQRTNAILAFLDNEIKAFGLYYNQFEDKIPFDVNVLINVNNLKTEKEVLTWYVEMNAGGTPHTKEEIEKVKRMIADCE